MTEYKYAQIIGLEFKAVVAQSSLVVKPNTAVPKKSADIKLKSLWHSNVFHKRVAHTSEPPTSKTHQKLEKSYLNILTTT